MKTKPKRPARPVIERAFGVDLESDEMSVLGSMIGLGRSDELEAVSAIVAPSDFSNPAFGKMFAMIQDMAENGEPFGDPQAVRPRLAANGLLEQIGGSIALAQIIESMSASPRYYAGRIKQEAARRTALKILHDCQNNLLDASANPHDVIQRAIESLEAVSSARSIEFKNAFSVAEDIVANLDKPAQKLIQTGLSKFDSELGGFAPGELIVLAARTSVGKTAMAAQIAEYNAEQGRPVLFCTLEMDSRDLVYRILAAEAVVNVKQLRARTLSGEQKQWVENASSKVTKNFWPQYMPSAKVRDIRAAAKAFKVQHGIGLLVVDYLQIISKPDYKMPTREAIGESTRTLKQLAGELDCPVLLLSQFNREATKQEAPTLANLSESSSIENDADMVVAIHRKQGDSKGELLVLKNRNGETVDLTGLHWRGAEMRFEFLSQQFDEFSQ